MEFVGVFLVRCKYKESKTILQGLHSWWNNELQLFKLGKMIFSHCLPFQCSEIWIKYMSKTVIVSRPAPQVRALPQFCGLGPRCLFLVMEWDVMRQHLLSTKSKIGKLSRFLVLFITGGWTHMFCREVQVPKHYIWSHFH